MSSSLAARFSLLVGQNEALKDQIAVKAFPTVGVLAHLYKPVQNSSLLFSRSFKNSQNFV
jgi:hypothetical protein